jgi:hypothetical protein
MATVTLRNDMTTLKEFLQSDAYTNAHPKEEQLIAAIIYMNNNIRVNEALVELKDALNEEKGWLMEVLREHKDNAAYVSAWAVCVRIYTSIQFMTGDSHAPTQPTDGEWHAVDSTDSADMSRLREIQVYCDFIVSCRTYTHFLVSRLDGELEKTHPGTLDAIMVMFTTYPRADQLLGFDMAFDSNQQSTQGVCYHTSYFTYSTTDHYSRSWLLANVRVVMQQLEKYKNTLFNDFPTTSRERHTRLYNTLLAEHKAWDTLARARFQPSFKKIQSREVTGHDTNLYALLEELRLVT